MSGFLFARYALATACSSRVISYSRSSGGGDPNGRVVFVGAGQHVAVGNRPRAVSVAELTRSNRRRSGAPEALPLSDAGGSH